MLKYLNNFLLSLMLLIGAACNNELPLPNATGGNKIVLLGELSANDSMLIRAGQSRALSGSGPGLIHDLQVTLQDSNGVRTALEEREDFMSYALYTVPFSNAGTVAANTTYHITAKHPLLGEVTAAVPIPKPFNAVLAGKHFGDYSGDSVLVFDIDINDPNAANARYVIEALKQPVTINGYFFFDGSQFTIADNPMLYDSLKNAGVNTLDHYDTAYISFYSKPQIYTTDQLTDNATGSGLGKLYKRIFLEGKNFTSTNHRTQILIPRKALYGDPGQHALTVIKVKSVASDYFTYLKAYEQYDPFTGIGSSATPANLHGNVQGGFGMVGGVFAWVTSVLY